MTLRGIGLSPTESGRTVRYPDLAVPGTAITFKGGKLYLFVYGDANTAGAAEEAAVDALARLPKPAPDSASLVLSTNNVVAVVFATDSTVRHRVRDALTREHLTP